MSLFEPPHQLQQQQKLHPSHNLSVFPPSSHPSLDTESDGGDSSQSDRRANNANTLTPPGPSDTVIQLTGYDHTSDLITFVPAPPTDTHSGRLYDYDTNMRRPDPERAPTLFNHMSWTSFGLGRSNRPDRSTIFRQGSKDSSKTLTMSDAHFPVRQGTKGSFDTYHSPPRNNLQLHIPTPPSEDLVVFNGTRKPSSPCLVHTLSLTSPPPPPPVLSPTGKRYIDTRKRNKKSKQGRKEALQTAKTLFSNERTFIHWIKFGMLLGALAMTLLNFSGQTAMTRRVDHDLIVQAEIIGQRVGVALMAICLLCLIYAACTFHWRHNGVAARKDDDRYFDRIGPTLLTLALLGTYSINVILTILVTSKLDSSYNPTVFYYNNNNDNNNNNNNINTIVGDTPNPTIPARPNYGLPPSPVFDTPRLPPGSTILVDSDDDDEDMQGYRSDIDNDSDTSHPSSESTDSSDLPTSSAVSTHEESSLKGSSRGQGHTTNTDQEDD
ncbi:hypothetical protein CPC16_008970 [Podila verticillata]|nr:hypothetical protein CPC16_008970 [Podila verticillata]